MGNAGYTDTSMIWPKEILKEAGIGLLMLDHLFRRVTDWEQDWEKARALWGRRKGDLKMINPFELVSKLEKLVTDIGALEQTPQSAAVIADVQAIIAEIKGSAAPITTSTTPAAA